MEVIRGHLGCPLSGGCPLFGGSAIGGSTVVGTFINPRRACAARVTVLGLSLTLGAHAQRGLR